MSGLAKNEDAGPTEGAGQGEAERAEQAGQHPFVTWPVNSRHL